jgi:hypothetical protein
MSSDISLLPSPRIIQSASWVWRMPSILWYLLQSNPEDWYVLWQINLKSEISASWTDLSCNPSPSPFQTHLTTFTTNKSRCFYPSEYLGCSSTVYSTFTPWTTSPTWNTAFKLLLSSSCILEQISITTPSSVYEGEWATVYSGKNVSKQVSCISDIHTKKINLSVKQIMNW